MAIGVVDCVTLIGAQDRNMHRQFPGSTKLYLRNSKRTSMTLLVKHWNEEKCQDLKVGLLPVHSLVYDARAFHQIFMF